MLYQLVVPKAMQNELLYWAHNHKLSRNLKRTIARIREHYYWSGCRRHVVRWCCSFGMCASRKVPGKKLNSELQLYGAEQLLQRCPMDIMGKLPISSRGYRYVLVIVDYFTRWTEA